MSAARDFSLFALFTAGLAAAAQLPAHRQPVGASPQGNSISLPGLHDVVPVGAAYTVTWKPTLANCGKVDLLLLKGPSSNAVPIQVLTTGYENSGTYSWTPSSDLEPTNPGYGIQLICDGSGFYQYTTQFGISNPHYGSHPSSSSSQGYGHSTTAAPSSGYSSGPVHTVYSESTITETDCSCTETSSTAGPTSYPVSTYAPGPTGSAPAPYGGGNGTSPYGTASVYTSIYSSPSATSSYPAIQTTNAGVKVGTGFGSLVLALGAAVFAL